MNNLKLILLGNYNILSICFFYKVIFRYDCFDSVIGAKSSFENLFIEKENSLCEQVLKGNNLAVILFGPQNSSKTRNLFSDDPQNSQYASRNLINILVANLLMKTKNPVLCVSFAEIVASPDKEGKVSFSLQDLLNGQNERMEEPTNVQITSNGQFDSLIQYAAEKSFGVLVPKEGEVHIENSGNTSFVMKISLLNKMSSITIIDMCEYKPRYFKSIKAKQASTIPPEIAINGLFDFLNHSHLEQTTNLPSELYKKLLDNRKIHFIFHINEHLQLAEEQPVINAIEK